MTVEREELETVIYEKDGAIARVILNRPEKANTQSSQLVLSMTTSSTMTFTPTRAAAARWSSFRRSTHR